MVRWCMRVWKNMAIIKILYESVEEHGYHEMLYESVEEHDYHEMSESVEENGYYQDIVRECGRT